MELEVLTQFYSDVQESILNPVAVASLLRQEGIASKDLLDEVSLSAKATLSDKTASIMRHVEAAVRTNAKSFWVFVAVLERSSPSCDIAGKMKEAMKLQVKSAQKKDDSICSSLTPTDSMFVSEVYKEDFDAIHRKFISLHHRVSDILEKNRSVPLKKLKRLLSTYADIKGPIKTARSYYDVMCVVLEHSSIINCSSLRLIAEHFTLPEVKRELDEYKEQVDEFCQKTIREHSYIKLFVGEQPKHFLSTQTITLKLEWKPDEKTLADIQSLIRKTFHGLSHLIHVDVISEGSVTVVCYAPHYLMGALVQMAEENKNMLLENSVSYLSIGYAIVLDREKKEARLFDLKQENTSLQLKCTALQDQCKELQLQLSRLSERKSDIELKQQFKEMLPDKPTRLTQRQSVLSGLGQTVYKKPQLHSATQVTSIEKLTETSQTQLSELVELGMSKNTPLLSEALNQITSTPFETDWSRAHDWVQAHLSELYGSWETHESDFWISHTKVTLGGVTPDSFRYMLEHQGVESIEFRQGDHTTGQVEAIFQGLRNNTTLHELDVPRTHPPLDMSILSASLTINNTLQDLTLRDDLNDHAMEQLSTGLRANGSVTRLTLHCRITDTGAQHLATMLAANGTIQELNLSSTYSGRIGDHRMEQLSVFQYHIRAQHRATMWAANKQGPSSYSNRISDHAMKQLSTGLRANRSVTRLKLECRITDTKAQHLATILAVNTTLQELDLSLGSITDNGVSRLSRALQHNSSVTYLNLSYNESITNTGAVALGEMLRVNKSLRELNLHGTSVGEEGATALMESLQHNQVLNELELPWKLEQYCKKHTLYGSVKSRTKFRFY